MAANTTETLPTIPAATSFMTMDASGSMATTIPVALGITASNIANQTITQGKLALKATGSTVAAGGYATSASSGAFTTSSGSTVSVTNLSITITTTGRPVFLRLETAPTLSNGIISVENIAAEGAVGHITFIRGGSTLLNSSNISAIAEQTAPTIGDVISIAVPPSSFSCMDPVAAGTYTYTVGAYVSSGNDTLSVINTILTAYEI